MRKAAQALSEGSKLLIGPVRHTIIRKLNGHCRALRTRSKERGNNDYRLPSPVGSSRIAAGWHSFALPNVFTLEHLYGSTPGGIYQLPKWVSHGRRTRSPPDDCPVVSVNVISRGHCWMRTKIDGTRQAFLCAG